MNPILPTGTQVVSRIEILPTGVPNKATGDGHRTLHPAGVVGVITSSPVDHTHAYRVRFPDGYEASLSRDEITPLKEFQSTQLAPPDALAEYDLQKFVIFRCIIGSRAYGLDHENSDTDRRGIYLPPADLHWSLYGIPEQLENKDTEECYWELQKFLVLALKANPNVLECLYSPLIEHATPPHPLAQELLAMRQEFLSTLAYQTYNGYVMSQFKKLSTDLRNKGEVKWKHVMHLLRLLLSGITLLKEAHVPVRIPDDQRDTLLAIKHGHWTWDQCNAWRLDLHEQFEAALATTPLPQRPNYAAANAFLLKARRSML